MPRVLYKAQYCVFVLIIIEYVPVSGNLNFFQDQIIPVLLKEGFDRALPTLVLTEVVLIYLKREPTLEILNWFARNLMSKTDETKKKEKALFGVSVVPGRSYLATLDPSSFSDPFGMMMIKNLESSSIYLVNELLLSGRSAFEGSLRDINWKLENSFTMRDAYEKYISEDEKKRICALEWIDELEEWDLLSSHYYFSVFMLDHTASKNQPKT